MIICSRTFVRSPDFLCSVYTHGIVDAVEDRVRHSVTTRASGHIGSRRRYLLP